MNDALTRCWKESKMSKLYYVNNDDTRNPNLHHEVHTAEHAEKLKITDKKWLGFYNDCKGAVLKANEHYSDADGCKTCCPDCNSD